MARGDDALTALRKAERKLREVQRNLAEASKAVDRANVGVSDATVVSDLVAVDELYAECTRLKESVIARYEAMGGTWG